MSSNQPTIRRTARSDTSTAAGRLKPAMLYIRAMMHSDLSNGEGSDGVVVQPHQQLVLNPSPATFFGITTAEQYFGSTPQELCGALKHLANAQQFSVNVSRSDHKKSVTVISCDRARVYQPKGKLRLTSNKKTGCAFRFACMRGTDTVWRVTEQLGIHNHPMSEDLSVHPKSRHLTTEQKQRCHQLQLSGVNPHARFAALRQEFPHIKAVMRDVYNKSNGRISYLCYSHPMSMAPLHQHHHLLLLDATYKTNKFKMSFLVCTGVTSTNRSFLW
ncbi:hypothetical protein PybrP1_013171 [[Pythium] brassicae (nom. inval.)]|nr:hypothetical protein PybrP1_013171 [[Pythium] brassicae (nom. inval.)]